MFCSQCGSALGSTDKFCSKCGSAVPISDVQKTSQTDTIAVTPTPHSVHSTSFRDPTKLTQWLKYFLYASIIIDFIALVSSVLEYQLLSDFKLGVYTSGELVTAAAESNDKRQQVIGWFRFAIAMTTIVLFSIWIYRANYNARQLGAQSMRFTPGWSVGYYFFPILWFWKPYQAMKEIWLASKAPYAWKAIEPSAILHWWWGFFLISAILGNASFNASLGIALRAEEIRINEILSTASITIASDAVSIPATIIALILVDQIYKMQMSHVQHRI
jgi:hypothetical protein